MIVEFSDITRRIRSIDNIKSDGSNYSPRLYTEHNVFCMNNAIYAIENWQTLAENSNEAFSKALDIYDEVCLNANPSTIRMCCYNLIEGVNKVRDASQLFRSLKNRFGRIKRKNTNKITRSQNDISDAIQDAINKVKSTMAANGVATPQQPSQATVEECYNLLIQEAKKVKECDRIINNYAKVSRRFNIDKLVSEVTSSDDLYLAVMEIARCMDTYDMKFKNKYSHALEMSYYALNKNNMNFSNSKIIEAVTDYFIFSSVLKENNIPIVNEVKKDAVLFTDDDFDSIDYLMDDEDSLFESRTAMDVIEDYCSPLRNINEGIAKDIKKDFKDKKKEVKKAARDLKKDARKGNPEERLDRKTQEEINEFRKECIKDPDNKNNITRLKSMVNGIFAKNPEQIVFCLPNVFNIMLAMVTILFTAINPIIGLLSFITNQIIKLTLSRKQTEKIVKAYQSEIDRVRDKLEKAKDEEAKDALQKYLDELNKDYGKIKEYENNLYSDEENYERDTSTEYNKDDEFDDDFGLDDWDDFDFEEAASIVYISDLMESISEGLIDDNIEGIVFNNIYKLDNDAIDQLTDFSITVPTILEKDKLCESLIEYRNKLRGSNHSIEDYIRIDCLNENIYKLRSNNMVYATSNNLSGIRCYLACLNEMVNLNASEQYMIEMNFTNTLKLAVNRLKKTAVKLKDKDRQISSSIDVAVNNVSKGMETAMMNGNREAVIKGKILPSASKCIKIACGLGVAWVVNPAIAVIAAIGGFACSAKLRSRERQLILDDLDIELKMCERYIKQAEDKNDLKKVRQLEMIQRNLLRQQQRLKYKMHVDFKQDDPLEKVGNNDDD